jgi:hypothetical protein
VVGYWETVTSQFDFLYTGGMYVTINPPGGAGANASGINDAGQIAGTYSTSTNHGYLAYPIGSKIKSGQVCIQ